MEQMDKRIDDMNQRLTEFREDFNRRLESVETELKGLRDKIDSDFKRILGFWLSTMALIISTMIPVALRILGVIQ